MTYDCFPFFNELDLLEVRLHTHNEFVDRFIIVEALQTHSGHDKPLFLQKNWDRFRIFQDKIIYYPITFPTDMSTFNAIPNNLIDWKRENYQREYIKHGLSAASPEDGDIVISSDLDEIIDPDTFLTAKNIINNQQLVRIKQKHYAYKLNYFCGIDTDGVIIATYNNIKNNNLTALRVHSNSYNFKTLVGGWHFSFLSKEDQNVYTKFKSFAHAQENADVIDKNTAVEKVKKCLIKQITNIDSTYPKFITDNLSSFKAYIDAAGVAACLLFCCAIIC